jgi:ribosomal protein L11 methyltransferase
MAMPSSWFVLTAHLAGTDPLRDLTTEGMLALGGLSVLEGHDSLTTYLPAEPEPRRQLARAEIFLADWIAADCPRLSWQLQPNEDWERSWKQGLRPRKVSRRLVVKPSWAVWESGPDEIVLEIDPQMAFGTGEHATTRSCLRLIDRWIQAGDRVLDVGSGTAILSIAAARLGGVPVIAVDCDADANLNARENIDRNGVSDRVELLERVADGAWVGSLGGFDLVLANLLSSVIEPLLPGLATTLRPRGRIIVSGILDRERPAILTAADALGLALVDEIYEEEWWTAVLVAQSGVEPKNAAGESVNRNSRSNGRQDDLQPHR